MKYAKLTAAFCSAAMTLCLGACGKTATPAATAAPAATAETAETPAATAETASTQAAIVGSWKLSKVLVSEKEGEQPAEVKEDDHASMFGEKNNVYTFAEDGTGTMVVVDGPDQVEKKVTWVTNDTGSYTVTEADAPEGEVYIYDPVEDVLMREFNGTDPYMHVVTVFARQ